VQDVIDCLDMWLDGKPYVHDRKGIDGHTWDGWVPGPEVWRRVYKAMKPGAYLFAFTGSRTLDLMGISIRLAGFEIRDTLFWVYSRPGFNKTGDVAGSVDKEKGVTPRVAGVTRQAPVGVYLRGGKDVGDKYKARRAVKTEPTGEDAIKWAGWSTGLSPCFEPIILARKPFDGTVAANLIQHETGALNIDKCKAPSASTQASGSMVADLSVKDDGYLPGNLIIDDEVAPIMDADAWEHRASDRKQRISRFFCCAKPTKEEKGLFNLHPTVKPAELMQYLVRLACLKGGRVLDPFAGSGTTLVACEAEGMLGDGIERDESSCLIGATRLEYVAGAAPKQETKKAKAKDGEMEI
jgi:site-specific DNA-methyltransferase (adenine-specific)